MIEQAWVASSLRRERPSADCLDHGADQGSALRTLVRLRAATGLSAGGMPLSISTSNRDAELSRGLERERSASHW